MEDIFKEEVDGYRADTHFRERAPRFVAYDRFKDRYREEMKTGQGGRKLFAPGDFFPPTDFCYWFCEMVFSTGSLCL